MLGTKRETMAALSAMHEATGCDLHDVGAVADIDPHAIHAVLELFVSATLAIAHGEGNAEVRARMVALLDQLAAIEAEHRASMAKFATADRQLDKIIAPNPGPLHHKPLQAPCPRRADGATTARSRSGLGCEHSARFLASRGRVPIADACSD